VAAEQTEAATLQTPPQNVPKVVREPVTNKISLHSIMKDISRRNSNTLEKMRPVAISSNREDLEKV
jgi:hypothetical protein